MAILSYYIIYAILSPIFAYLSEYKAYNIAMSITNKAINENLKNTYYSDLVSIEKNNENQINMIRFNTLEMNKICSDISLSIQKQLENLDNVYVFLPLGTIFGNKFLMNVGPNIKIKLLPQGVLTTNFSSEFNSNGINQTVHKLYINVNCTISIITPFTKTSSTFKNSLLINEVIIVGDVPDSFYNLHGITEDDSLNFIE